MEFLGYRRSDGRVGIRNHVLILPACACGSESCRVVASQVRGAVNIIFNTGCSDVAANTAMSQKVLTAQLRDMEESGLLSRKVYAEVPPRVEYTLTDLGYSLKPILDALWNWGEEYKAKQ